ncbi:MAG: cadherin-like domain-containing protein [Geminicoccaceae bacterium]
MPAPAILFSGARATYRITDLGGGVVEVVDQDATADGNDGTDRIANAELLQFKDQTVDLRVSANRAPVAVDDTLASQAEDAAARTITFASLTGNDTDADGNALTVTAVGNAAGGTVSIVSGQVRFVASANFNGTAGFDYTVSDGQGGSDVGRVSFTVTPVNDAPVAVDDVLAGQRIGAPAESISFASLTGTTAIPTPTD